MEDGQREGGCASSGLPEQRDTRLAWRSECIDEDVKIMCPAIEDLGRGREIRSGLRGVKGDLGNMRIDWGSGLARNVVMRTWGRRMPLARAAANSARCCLIGSSRAVTCASNALSAASLRFSASMSWARVYGVFV
jgi:hypothetical protein